MRTSLARGAALRALATTASAAFRALATVMMMATPALAQQPPPPAGAPGATAPSAAPVAPPKVVSMGQPRRWLPYASGSATPWRDDDSKLSFALGVYHSIGSPVNGVLGLAGEAWGATGGENTGGARLLGVTRAINLGYGVDWDARQQNLAFMLSWSTAVRRGGVFGGGSLLRVDWIPPRGRWFEVGLTMPLLQPYAGRTRPHSTDVDLEDVVRQTPGAATPASSDADILRRYKSDSLILLTPAVDSAMRAVREAALLIRIYTNFFSEHHESSRAAEIERTRVLAQRVRDSMAVQSARYPNGHSAADAQRVYFGELAHAFGLAAGDSATGVRLARRARSGLLELALLPYDAQFGRVKNDQYDLHPLVDATALDFLRWLRDSSGVPQARREDVARVHAEWLSIIGQVHKRLVTQWTDSRRVWLPLQLALSPDQYDEQREIDALIERAEGRSFTNGNQVDYLHENDVQVEIARSILVARDYHVLWVHDFAGRRASGAVDRVGYRQVADTYFPALTNAVARFDSTGQLTTFMIFLDQNFYEPADGRLWMTILEDPLGARIELPEGNDSLVAHLRERQRALREAVAHSRGLQALAARQGGEDWLHRTVKVHVSITQPSDFTFRSHRIIPPVPLLPDNLMRDHRKIAFYDVTERDPDRGAMVLSGVGVGEHYASPTWQDRGMLIRGPAVLEVRAAARRLLKLNSFKDGEIPLPLRESATVSVADGDVSSSDVAGGKGDGIASAAVPGMGRALLVMNEPGFGRKQATVARAMLYSLAPRGSVVVVPDGLWLDGAWAGMLAGAALRGVRVFIIAPAIANAPSAGFPQMAHTGDVILRLLQVRQEFGAQIHRAGGELRVGLFAPTEDVNDIVRQVHEIRAGVARYPWLRDLMPFPDEALAVLDSASTILAAVGYTPFALGRDETPRRPQLHQKTQFFADSDALAQLAARPEWREVARQYLLARAAQSRGRAGDGGRTADSLRARVLPALTSLVQGYLANRPARDSTRMSFYFTLGTQNQDPRGMMLDGEAVLVTSGLSGAVGMFDMYSLLARTTWVESQEEMDQLLPPYDDWMRRLGRFARFVL